MRTILRTMRCQNPIIDSVDAALQRKSPWVQTVPPVNVVALGLGQPPASLLPARELREMYAKSMDEGLTDPLFLQYHLPLGSTADRRSLAAYLSRANGVQIGAAHVGLASGVSATLSILATVLYTPGAVALVERPCYFLAPAIFKRAGFDVVGLPTDVDGIRTDILARALWLSRAAPPSSTSSSCSAVVSPPWNMHAQPTDMDVGSQPLPSALDEAVASRIVTAIGGRPVRVLYTVPVHGNPTGNTLGLQRRLQLLAACRASGVVVAADEVYQLLSLRSSPRPPTTNGTRADGADCYGAEVDAAVAAAAAARAARGEDLSSAVAGASDEDININVAANSASLPSAPVPPLACVDVGAAAFGVSSFTKTFAPAARAGHVHAGSVEALKAFQNAAVHGSGGGVNCLGAAAMAVGLRDGQFHSVRGRLVGAYRERLDALQSALQSLMPSGVEVVGGAAAGGREGDTEGAFEVTGGYFVWISFPPSVCASALAKKSAAAGVAAHPGRMFEPTADVMDEVVVARGGSAEELTTKFGTDWLSALKFDGHSLPVVTSPVSRMSSSMRLCFAFYEAPILHAAVERLGQVVRDEVPAAFLGGNRQPSRREAQAASEVDVEPVGDAVELRVTGDYAGKMRLWAQRLRGGGVVVRGCVLCRSPSASIPRGDVVSLSAEAVGVSNLQQGALNDVFRAWEGGGTDLAAVSPPEAEMDDVVGLHLGFGADGGRGGGVTVVFSRLKEHAVTSVAATGPESGEGVRVCRATHRCAADAPAHFVFDVSLPAGAVGVGGMAEWEVIACEASGSALTSGAFLLCFPLIREISKESSLREEFEAKRIVTSSAG